MSENYLWHPLAVVGTYLWRDYWADKMQNGRKASEPSKGIRSNYFEPAYRTRIGLSTTKQECNEWMPEQNSAGNRQRHVSALSNKNLQSSRSSQVILILLYEL